LQKNHRSYFHEEDLEIPNKFSKGKKNDFWDHCWKIAGVVLQWFNFYFLTKRNLLNQLNWFLKWWIFICKMRLMKLSKLKKKIRLKHWKLSVISISLEFLLIINIVIASKDLELKNLLLELQKTHNILFDKIGLLSMITNSEFSIWIWGFSIENQNFCLI